VSTHVCTQYLARFEGLVLHEPKDWFYQLFTNFLPTFYLLYSSLDEWVFVPPNRPIRKGTKNLILSVDHDVS
jgi:hypothetical protein